jgi:hypothetical protein
MSNSIGPIVASPMQAIAPPNAIEKIAGCASKSWARQCFHPKQIAHEKSAGVASALSKKHLVKCFSANFVVSCLLGS